MSRIASVTPTLVMTLVIAACSNKAQAPMTPPSDKAGPARAGHAKSEPGKAGDPGAESSAPSPSSAPCATWDPEAPYSTRLRGTIKAPDPRLATTLAGKKYTVDRDGIDRALASDDFTAHLAALTAVSALRCRSLLGAVERHLSSSAPVALEAAATLVELGDTEQQKRGKRAVLAALADASWPETQLNAATYLARAGDATGLDVLRRALQSDQEALRLQAVLAVGAFAGMDGLDPVAVYETILLGPDPSALVRRETVYRLAALPPSPRRDALLQNVAAKDPDPRVRRAAANRL